MKSVRLPAVTLLALLAALQTGTASGSDPPDVGEIHIQKAAHRLDLLASDGNVVARYRVAIGPGGAGPKRMEGDRVTPVGTYRVVGRIKGLYHQFLTIDYPNDADRKRYSVLKKEGLVPPGVGVGNGIGIHGTGHAEWNGVHKESDWTLGCIALDDDEIDEVARRVKDGTRVVITD
jgi:murein L,D-transpeptidase YafK